LKGGEGNPLYLHSELRLDQPTKGFTQTNEAQFELKGQMTKANGDRLYLQIDKKNERGFTSIKQVDLVFNNNEFKESISFSSGNGLYRISIQSVSNNQQNVKRVAMFYLGALYKQ
jgi:hypothetical protein